MRRRTELSIRARITGGRTSDGVRGVRDGGGGGRLGNYDVASGRSRYSSSVTNVPFARQRTSVPHRPSYETSPSSASLRHVLTDFLRPSSYVPPTPTRFHPTPSSSSSYVSRARIRPLPLPSTHEAHGSGGYGGRRAPHLNPHHHLVPDERRRLGAPVHLGPTGAVLEPSKDSGYRSVVSPSTDGGRFLRRPCTVSEEGRRRFSTATSSVLHLSSRSTSTSRSSLFAPSGRDVGCERDSGDDEESTSEASSSFSVATFSSHCGRPYRGAATADGDVRWSRDKRRYDAREHRTAPSGVSLVGDASVTAHEDDEEDENGRILVTGSSISPTVQISGTGRGGTGDVASATALACPDESGVLHIPIQLRLPSSVLGSCGDARTIRPKTIHIDVFCTDSEHDAEDGGGEAGDVGSTNEAVAAGGGGWDGNGDASSVATVFETDDFRVRHIRRKNQLPRLYGAVPAPADKLAEVRRWQQESSSCPVPFRAMKRKAERRCRTTELFREPGRDEEEEARSFSFPLSLSPSRSRPVALSDSDLTGYLSSPTRTRTPDAGWLSDSGALSSSSSSSSTATAARVSDSSDATSSKDTGESETQNMDVCDRGSGRSVVRRFDELFEAAAAAESDDGDEDDDDSRPTSTDTTASTVKSPQPQSVTTAVAAVEAERYGGMGTACVKSMRESRVARDVSVRRRLSIRECNSVRFGRGDYRNADAQFVTRRLGAVDPSIRLRYGTASPTAPCDDDIGALCVLSEPTVLLTASADLPNEPLSASPSLATTKMRRQPPPQRPPTTPSEGTRSPPLLLHGPGAEERTPTEVWSVEPVEVVEESLPRGATDGAGARAPPLLASAADREMGTGGPTFSKLLVGKLAPLSLFAFSDRLKTLKPAPLPAKNIGGCDVSRPVTGRYPHVLSVGAAVRIFGGAKTTPTHPAAAVGAVSASRSAANLEEPTTAAETKTSEEKKRGLLRQTLRGGGGGGVLHESIEKIEMRIKTGEDAEEEVSVSRVDEAKNHRSPPQLWLAKPVTDEVPFTDGHGGRASDKLSRASRFGQVVAHVKKPGHHVGPAKNPNCCCECCARFRQRESEAAATFCRRPFWKTAPVTAEKEWCGGSDDVTTAKASRAMGPVRSVICAFERHS